MKKLMLIGSGIGVILLLGSLLLPSLAWDGAVTVELHFRVRAEISHPVEGAIIKLLYNSQLRNVRSTDANGVAKMHVMCGAGGSSGLFGRTGHFIIPHELVVEADGYRSTSTSLATLLGGKRLPLSKRRFDVEIFLIRDP